MMVLYKILQLKFSTTNVGKEFVDLLIPGKSPRFLLLGPLRANYLSPNTTCLKACTLAFV